MASPRTALIVGVIVVAAVRVSDSFWQGGRQVLWVVSAALVVISVICALAIQRRSRKAVAWFVSAVSLVTFLGVMFRFTWGAMAIAVAVICVLTMMMWSSRGKPKAEQ